MWTAVGLTWEDRMFSFLAADMIGDGMCMLIVIVATPAGPWLTVVAADTAATDNPNPSKINSTYLIAL